MEGVLPWGIAKYEGKARKIGVVVGFFPTHLFAHTLPVFGEGCEEYIAQSVVLNSVCQIFRVSLSEM